jgi:hypothetical protein
MRPLRTFLVNFPAMRRYSRLFLFSLTLGSFALANVDDAKAAADLAAETAVKEGFAKREEHWSGLAKSGALKGVKAQLFKGNEYYFWLGCGHEEVTVTLAIYDLKGKLVSTQGADFAKGKSVKVTPPATGAYVVKFSVVNKKDAKVSVDWALTYGYR